MPIQTPKHLYRENLEDLVIPNLESRVFIQFNTSKRAFSPYKGYL